MKKLMKFLAALACLSMLLVSAPSENASAATAGCGSKIWIKTETWCYNGTTYIRTTYSQTCTFADGHKETRPIIETVTHAGCQVVE